jgi:DnaD/phage-associated family protein
MIRYEFDFPIKASETEEFKDASIGEIKVLLALIEAGGSISDDELSELCGLSKARVSAALALWQETGVIAEREYGKEVSFYGNKVANEFPEREVLGELTEESSVSVAKTIRDKRLASLFDEIANMMGKAMLTPQEIKKISELASQYELSEEYIATLSAHLLAEGKLSVGILVRRAINLVGEGIITADSLVLYISEREQEKNEYMEYRRIFGIFDRKLSPMEKELIQKWSRSYAFGREIVTMAYDICVMNTAKLSFKYMDKLLSDWNESGCKTLEDCEKRYSERKAELDLEMQKKREDNEKRRPSKNKEATQGKVKYGDFDPEEAFRIALSRSFSDGND